MNKMLQITETSWIMKKGSTNVGLVFKNQDSRFSFLSGSSRLEFTSLDHLSEKFGKLEFQELNNDKGVLTLNGYPVKHENIKIIDEEKGLYNKGSDLVFAAGYWVFRTNENWLLALCPKNKTVTDNESVGPFRNKIEAMNQVTKLNNKRNFE